MILSDDEIQYLLDGCHSSNTWTLVERTIAATIAKLAAGVSVEPDFREVADRVLKNLDGRKGVLCLDVDADIEEEIRQEAADTIKSGTTTAIAAARVAALTEAEQVVLADCVKNPVTEYQRQYNITLQSTAGSIRALIGKEST